MIIRTLLVCKSLSFSLIEGERIINNAGRFCSSSLTQSFVCAVKQSENLNLLPSLLLVLPAFSDVSLFSLTFCACFLSKIYLPILCHLLFPQLTSSMCFCEFIAQELSYCLNSLLCLQWFATLRLCINVFNVLCLKFAKKRVCQSTECRLCETKGLLNLLYISNREVREMNVKWRGTVSPLFCLFECYNCSQNFVKIIGTELLSDSSVKYVYWNYQQHFTKQLHGYTVNQATSNPNNV